MASWSVFLSYLIILLGSASILLNLTLLFVLVHKGFLRSGHNNIYLLAFCNLCGNVCQVVPITFYLGPSILFQSYLFSNGKNAFGAHFLGWFVLSVWDMDLLFLTITALNRVCAIVFPSLTLLLNRRKTMLACGGVVVCGFLHCSIGRFLFPCCKFYIDYRFYSFSYLETGFNFVDKYWDLPISILATTVTVVSYTFIFVFVRKWNRLTSTCLDANNNKSRKLQEIRYAVQFGLCSMFSLFTWTSFRILPLVAPEGVFEVFSFSTFSFILHNSSNAIIFITLNREFLLPMGDMTLSSIVIGSGLTILGLLSLALNSFMLYTLLVGGFLRTNMNSIYILAFFNIMGNTLQVAMIAFYLGPTSIIQRDFFAAGKDSMGTRLLSWAVLGIWYLDMMYLMINSINRLIAVVFPNLNFLFTRQKTFILASIVFVSGFALSYVSDFVVPCCSLYIYYGTYSYTYLHKEPNYVNKYIDMPFNIITSIIALIAYVWIFVNVHRWNQNVSKTLSLTDMKSRRVRELRYAFQFALCSFFAIFTWISFRVFPIIFPNDKFEWYCSMALAFLIHNTSNSAIFMCLNKEIQCAIARRTGMCRSWAIGPLSVDTSSHRHTNYQNTTDAKMSTKTLTPSN